MMKKIINLIKRREEKIDQNSVERDNLLRSYYEALEEKKIAEQNFENADPMYIDVANFELSAKLSKVDLIIKELKSA